MNAQQALNMIDLPVRALVYGNTVCKELRALGAELDQKEEKKIINLARGILTAWTIEYAAGRNIDLPPAHEIAEIHIEQNPQLRGSAK